MVPPAMDDQGREVFVKNNSVKLTRRGLALSRAPMGLG